MMPTAPRSIRQAAERMGEDKVSWLELPLSEVRSCGVVFERVLSLHFELRRCSSAASTLTSAFTRASSAVRGVRRAAIFLELSSSASISGAVVARLRSLARAEEGGERLVNASLPPFRAWGFSLRWSRARPGTARRRRRQQDCGHDCGRIAGRNAKRRLATAAVGSGG